MDLFEEKVNEDEGFRGPRIIVVFLHAVQNLPAPLGEVGIKQTLIDIETDLYNIEEKFLIIAQKGN